MKSPNMQSLFSKKNAVPWVFVAMMAVSTAAILIRLSDSHPLTIALWRLIIAEAVLLPFSVITLKRERGLITGKDHLVIALTGGALALHFSLWIWSFDFTTVASSVLLVTTHPLFVAFISYTVFDERLDKTTIIGMVLALFGSFFIIGGDISVSGSALKGNLLALGGGVMAGIYILSGSRFRRRLSLPSYGFMVYGWAAMILLSVSLITGIDPVPSPPKEYLIFSLMALGPMLLGHTIYNWTLKYVSPTMVSVSLLGEPVGASILAFLILGETPALGAWIGGPLVMMGIFLVASK